MRKKWLVGFAVLFALSTLAYTANGGVPPGKGAAEQNVGRCSEFNACVKSLPQGAVGPAGPKGAPGTAGPAGAVGPQGVSGVADGIGLYWVHKTRNCKYNGPFNLQCPNIVVECLPGDPYLGGTVFLLKNDKSFVVGNSCFGPNPNSVDSFKSCLNTLGMTPGEDGETFETVILCASVVEELKDPIQELKK